MNAPQSFTVSDMPRRKFTAADVQHMLEAGILTEADKVELIDGELVEMSPQGPLHWGLNQKLVSWFLRRLPTSIELAANGPLRLDDLNEPEPDFFLFPADLDVNAVRGRDVALVVEVAVSSLPVDLAVKAPLYARCGVREYWVIDAAARQTLVFAAPSQNGFRDPVAASFDAALRAPGIDEALVISRLLDR